MMKKLTFLIIFFAQSTIFAESSNVHTKLNNTVDQITHTNKELQTDQLKHRDLESNLKSYERSIGLLSKDLDSAEVKLDQKITQINKLKSAREKLEAVSNQQHRDLQLLMKQVYMNGKLHNQHSQNRLSVYEHYLSGRYSKQLQSIKITVSELKKNQEQITQDTAALTRMRDHLNMKQHQLQEQKNLRQQTLGSLSIKIQSERDRLKKLIADKDRLEKMISTLQTSKVFNPKYNFNNNHKMPWPTQGKLIVRFGEKIGNSQLHSNGVEIAAPMNTPIMAIAAGKVVFNDWMPGFGLLLIIDHGKGYMSIYGHNNATYKNTGETVEAGDIIAKVGSSGGLESSELYFGIRYNGKPLDPCAWCI